MDIHSLSGQIRELARKQGIDALGFAHASAFSGYLLHRHRRRDPALSLPGARSIIVAGIYIGGAVMPRWGNPSHGRTSRLFLSGFFLDVVKPLLPLAEFLRAEGHLALVCDGSAPGGSIIPLKLAAIRAGAGLAGQALTAHFQKVRNLPGPGGDSDQRRVGKQHQGGAQPLPQLPAMPRCLPHGGTGAPSCPGHAKMPFLPVTRGISFPHGQGGNGEPG